MLYNTSYRETVQDALRVSVWLLYNVCPRFQNSPHHHISLDIFFFFNLKHRFFSTLRKQSQEVELLLTFRKGCKPVEWLLIATNKALIWICWVCVKATINYLLCLALPLGIACIYGRDGEDRAKFQISTMLRSCCLRKTCKYEHIAYPLLNHCTASLWNRWTQQCLTFRS